MTSTLVLVLRFVFDLLCLLFWARFLLQASKADFYNPISQAVVKATDPICKPLRLVLKSVGSFDVASLFVAWLIAVLGVTTITFLIAPEYLSTAVLVSGTVRALIVLTQFYFFAILIMVIASFLAPGNYNPALALIQQLLEPIMAPIRRIMPSMGPLDLSPMVVILIIIVVQNVLSQLG